MTTPPVARPLTPAGKAALQIWQAGVAAVDSHGAVQRQIHPGTNQIRFRDVVWQAAPDSRILVVGAGKAGAGMAAGLEQALAGNLSGTDWLSRVTGWINVPEDCVQPLRRITLHPARPAGINEPTPAGVAGTREILKRMQAQRPQDLCVVLISGGGSALLPLPRAEISLQQKLEITRGLAGCGATIEELNLVRRTLSDVKAGGLWRACRAGTMLVLVISDVIGSPLDLIAAGPTMPTPADPQAALQVLEKFERHQSLQVPEAVRVCLLHDLQTPAVKQAPTTKLHHLLIASNQMAVEAAATKARELGYHVALTESDQPGLAAETGTRLAEALQQLVRQGTPECLISGGETTVQLAPGVATRKGGRNQELALAAALAWLQQPEEDTLALASGGTDGEDGPTDAAGAIVDAGVLRDIRNRQLNPQPYLDCNDSYPFFDQLQALIRTGPTHTNVMDLRVGVVGTP